MAGPPSAGILLYRRPDDRLEVLLVHPGGPFWRNRDVGAWQIPKGAVNPGEGPAEAARREFEEELGARLDGELVALGEFRQAGGKRVHLFVAEGDLDAEMIRSIDFALEWPPRSGKMASFPEVDRARWFGIAEARAMILSSQEVVLDRLLSHLGAGDITDL